jgi:hypothetical protein
VVVDVELDLDVGILFLELGNRRLPGGARRRVGGVGVDRDGAGDRGAAEQDRRESGGSEGGEPLHAMSP